MLVGGLDLFLRAPELLQSLRNLDFAAFPLLGGWLRLLLQQVKSAALALCKELGSRVYLQLMKGISFSLSHHSSVITILSWAIFSPSTVFLCLFACEISSATYGAFSVFRILKKYYLSGTLPFGNLSGKKFMNSRSALIYGQRDFTESSSYKGTLIHLTSDIFISFLLPAKIDFKKSLFMAVS